MLVLKFVNLLYKHRLCNFLSVAYLALCQAGLNEEPADFLWFCCVDGKILAWIYASL